MSDTISTSTGNKKQRIAVVHDAFLYRGGGERLVTLMAKSLDADLVSGFFSEGSFDPRELGYTGKMLPLGRPVFMKGLRHLVLKYRFRYLTDFLKDYDVLILSGNCLDVLDTLQHIPVEKRPKIYYYCHTPPRYIFDLRDSYIANIHPYLHKIANKALQLLGKSYIRQLGYIDTLFTNSQNVHDRLLTYCGYDSHILYPPVDIEHFSPYIDTGGNTQQSTIPIAIPNIMPSTYFLSCARLSPPKRVDIIIQAFLDMPEKNLVYTYGPNDPMREYILNLSKNAPNIYPIMAPIDRDFIYILQHATANIYIPVDEDFGMTPIESMACGVPVIGVDEGGLLETVVHTQTGKLIHIADADEGVHTLQEVVQNTTDIEWQSMKGACISRAKDFSLDTFTTELKRYIL